MMFRSNRFIIEFMRLFRFEIRKLFGIFNRCYDEWWRWENKRRDDPFCFLLLGAEPRREGPTINFGLEPNWESGRTEPRGLVGETKKNETPNIWTCVLSNLYNAVSLKTCRILKAEIQTRLALLKGADEFWCLSLKFSPAGRVGTAEECQTADQGGFSHLGAVCPASACSWSEDGTDHTFINSNMKISRKSDFTLHRTTVNDAFSFTLRFYKSIRHYIELYSFELFRLKSASSRHDFIRFTSRLASQFWYFPRCQLLFSDLQWCRTSQLWFIHLKFIRKLDCYFKCGRQQCQLPSSNSRHRKHFVGLDGSICFQRCDGCFWYSRGVAKLARTFSHAGKKSRSPFNKSGFHRRNLCLLRPWRILAILLSEMWVWTNIQFTDYQSIHIPKTNHYRIRRQKSPNM